MCVLQWFERRVSTGPDACAVVCENRRVTYRELNLTADRIAHGLRAAGVGNGDLVGVLLDRSPEMVAGLLAIWKAGGVYIPLDSAAPAQRIAFMLEDSAPAFVLTRRKLLSGLSCPPARMIDLDDLCVTQSPRISPLPADKLSADSLAYVTYTSGSTGKPKGVRITHGALANTIQGVGQDLGMGPEDVVLAWSTIAFDVACLEIYLPLAFGGCLYLVEKELVHVGGLRLEQLRRSAATIIFGTPTMYRLLLEEGWQGDARMQLVAGGEVLPLALAQSLAGMCRTLWNQYGPTETGICATRARIRADAEKITIGHPLPNVRVHLLDQELQTVPQGSIGEVYLGGAGVGLGYLHRPELTQACFLRDPFSEGAGGRMYKTGDLARQLGDGSFDFLGRVDGQVKIRGFRIELGEIESALRQCAGVEAVVVRAIELGEGDRRLVAFVIGDASLLEDQWKQSLVRQLPAYMIPSEFVSLPSLPTTPSGKVDVQALDGIRFRSAKLAPETGTPAGEAIDTLEGRLRAIWERLLKVKVAGVHEDFFELGGHSLLAARMLVLVEQSFGCKLPPSVLVEHRTIHGLATCLRQGPAGKWPALVTIQAGGDWAPLFIAHGIGGSLLSFIELAAQLGPEQPVYGLQLPAWIDEGQAEIGILASNYLEQVRAIQPAGPYHFAGHSSGGLVAFEMACQLREQGETVGLLALLDSDPNTGKVKHEPFRDWESLMGSLRRTCAGFKLFEFGPKVLFRRGVDYQKIKFRIWQAARSRRTGKDRGRLVEAEGYLALALQDYELRPYSGDGTLFVAEDEPGSGEAARAWEGCILGRCETRRIKGSHATILNHPQVISLGREIRLKMPAKVKEDLPSVVA